MVHVNPAPKFKGYLLCSDCDGTLTYGEEVLSEENVKAIKYFQKEGGIFTLATEDFLNMLISLRIDSRLTHQ